jgi:hypothetical protein
MEFHAMTGISTSASTSVQDKRVKTANNM